MDKVGTGDDAEPIHDYGSLSPRDVAPIRAIWWLNRPKGKKKIDEYNDVRNEMTTRDKANLRSGRGMVCKWHETNRVSGGMSVRKG